MIEEVTRTLVVWCGDWPVVAAGVMPDEPAVVLHANRVVACSMAARAEGVKRGLRRREAQARCPEVTVIAADADRDARAFEPIAAAVETMAPRLEVVRPGTLAVPARGPSRYHGGDQAIADQARALASAVVAGRGIIGTGVADGLVAAVLAARRAESTVIDPGVSAAFLAPQPVNALDRVMPDAPVLELVSLFQRLGLRTMGDVAAVPPADLVGRFGPLGTIASRIARGLDERPPRPRRPDPELTVSMELDPPVEQVETAAFVARTLSAELGERLSSRGLACTRLAIEVETEHGESLSRLWRHEGGLGPAAIADRVRWQLDGWLNRASWGDRPTGGIALLRLVPDQVVPDDGRQLGFWGGVRAADERAARGIARLQGLLGADAVAIPERRGGRGPADRVSLVPAHAVRLGAAPVTEDAARPWPGHVPAPSPALVHAEPAPADVRDATGEVVGVTGRGAVSAAPVAVTIGGNRPVAIDTWCGPWPVDERWWDDDAHNRRARIQVVTVNGDAHLLALDGGRWWVEATYD
jgi:protein ImuB